MVNKDALTQNINFELQNSLKISADNKEANDGLTTIVSMVLQILDAMGYIVIKDGDAQEQISQHYNEIHQAIESCIHTTPEEGVELFIDIPSIVKQLRHYGFIVAPINIK
jgi:uncharacterized membrane protein